MSDCFCFRNYQCLACERNEGKVQPTARSQANRKVAQCGTRAGYARHLKQGEPTCAECKAAQSLAVIAYKRAKEGRESA